jgi:hypothetical protein
MRHVKRDRRIEICMVEYGKNADRTMAIIAKLVSEDPEDELVFDLK